MTNGRIIAVALTLGLAACAGPTKQKAEPMPDGFVGRDPQYAMAGVAGVATLDAMSRMERIDPGLNAVIAEDPTVLDQARRLDEHPLSGPLFGKPILIKDNIEVAAPGLATTAG